MVRNLRRDSGLHEPITVLVHGIWMHGVLMQVMARMLQKKGFRTRSVSYDFLTSSPAENACALHDQIAALGAGSVNLVGHSLGGIVILHLLHQFPDIAINRIVLIGSPVRGSSLARRVHESSLLRPFLGRSVEQGLLGGAPGYTSNYPLGIITGTGRLGLAALLASGDQNEDSDGVVKASETRLENATDRISLPLTHSTLIFSERCTEYVARFLTLGRFRP